jgi:hypothetical protein
MISRAQKQQPNYTMGKEFEEIFIQRKYSPEE